MLFFSLVDTESYHETLADCGANLRNYLAMNQTNVHRFEDFIRHLVTTVCLLEFMNLHICGQIFTERKSDRCVDSAPHFNRMHKVSPTQFIKISPISNSDKREQKRYLYNCFHNIAIITGISQLISSARLGKAYRGSYL